MMENTKSISAADHDPTLGVLATAPPPSPGKVSPRMMQGMFGLPNESRRIAELKATLVGFTDEVRDRSHG